MPTLLRIDSSARTQGSHSRELADRFQQQWLAKHPGGKVVLRDLAKSPVPHVSDLTIAGFYMPEEQKTPEIKAALKLSDTLIDEFLAADTLLFSIPMYNFSVPSALKAYIDHIIRIGRTFHVDTNGTGGLFSGLVKGKKAYITSSYGAAGYIGGAMTSYDFLQPFMRALLGFIGVTDVTFFAVEGAALDPTVLEASHQKAVASISALAG